MSEPYRPSNGTEGDIFMAKFCQNCALCDEDNDNPCEILGLMLFNSIDSEDYPDEIIKDKSGPRCTAFRAVDGPLIEPPCELP